MFERYTGQARRCLFYTRYEAGQRGCPRIESEHVLLGIIRESRGVARSMFAQFRVDPATIVRAVAERAPVRQAIPPSVEIEFSPEVQRILNGAREEADHLEHRHIGVEHLLLALLREHASTAASILSEAGISADEARAYVAKLPPPPASPLVALPRDAIDAQIEVIKTLVDQLSRAERNTPETEDLVARIHRALDGLGGGPIGEVSPRR
jgi:ATP-dependent Clp protease ATP-binding subunit ClpC